MECDNMNCPVCGGKTIDGERIFEIFQRHGGWSNFIGDQEVRSQCKDRLSDTEMFQILNISTEILRQWVVDKNFPEPVGDFWLREDVIMWLGVVRGISATLAD